MKSIDYWQGYTDACAEIRLLAGTRYAGFHPTYIFESALVQVESQVRPALVAAKNLEVEPWFDVKANWKLPRDPEFYKSEGKQHPIHSGTMVRLFWDGRRYIVEVL